MKFCPNCDHVMERDTRGATVSYTCRACGAQEEGSPHDARVGGAVLGMVEQTAIYDSIIEHAAHDVTNLRMRRDCPQCESDYMTLVRVGSSEVVVFTCKCGARVQPNDPAARAALEAHERKRAAPAATEEKKAA